MAYLSKILVVDDSELNRLMLCDILEDKYELLEARNGARRSRWWTSTRTIWR